MSHVNIGKVHPEAFQAMSQLNERASEAAASAGLEPKLVELVRMRVSQINGCAFCLRMHAADAERLGETSERIAILAAWWESQYFTGPERAALQLAEQVTLMSDASRIPERGVDVSAELDDAQIAAVTWNVVVINAWNRIAVSSHYPVAPKE
ncbi:carboxymuconolactone decarboxylase family protein [Leucobacter allii]|uniref:Carboxymuconolactone decarboxylase family protein n=1 Tax=Leucobacter allii TaxID=2932247 RepID=A0ABY4FJB9_9MICO|nr:carboxymuconolactone decarboxylase family protein [Leucobacter allii]UOQ56039.1 carboxymuconolactone decarboxylase family protein [Leucobacter allii]UOR00563.1 carboxymuconolactone decarboxylase family protein [Leucobacter allii]